MQQFHDSAACLQNVRLLPKPFWFWFSLRAKTCRTPAPIIRRRVFFSAHRYRLCCCSSCCTAHGSVPVSARSGCFWICLDRSARRYSLAHPTRFGMASRELPTVGFGRTVAGGSSISPRIHRGSRPLTAFLSCKRRSTHHLLRRASGQLTKAPYGVGSAMPMPAVMLGGPSDKAPALSQRLCYLATRETG